MDDGIAQWAEMTDEYTTEDERARTSPCHYCGKLIGGEWVSFRRVVDDELVYAHESACP